LSLDLITLNLTIWPLIFQKTTVFVYEILWIKSANP
jgi:hypothetical protein